MSRRSHTQPVLQEVIEQTVPIPQPLVFIVMGFCIVLGAIRNSILLVIAPLRYILAGRNLLVVACALAVYETVRLEQLTSSVANLRRDLLTSDTNANLFSLHTLDSTPKPLTGDIERADFALFTSGGRVLSKFTSPTMNDRSLEQFRWSVAARAPTYPWPTGALMAIHYETQPGYCWPFSGSNGTLGVQLSKRIFVDGFAIDHVAAHLTWDRTPAPRRMEVWGLVESPEDMAVVSAANGLTVRRQRSFLDETVLLRLAQFEYDIQSAQPTQAFVVPEDVKGLHLRFGTVVLYMLDNWGNEEFTCLYRFRVYGGLDLKNGGVQM